MYIQELQLEGFTTHQKTVLTFPKKGVVLVTGPNGSGKSSMLEGASWAGWGESLRGTPPGGDEKQPCVATLVANDGVQVKRKRSSGKTSLDWWPAAGASKASFPTVSKAQESLEHLLGSFETWRRTHVFSSADAAHFTLATDKERKIFLERWTGLGKFDGALATCREELKGAEARFSATQGRLQMLRNEVDALKRRKEDAAHTLASLPDKAPPGGYDTVLATLKHSIKATEESLRHLRQEQRELSQAKASHWADAKALQGRLARLTTPGSKCGECGRPLTVDESAWEKLKQEVDAARSAAEIASNAVARQELGVEEQIKDDERTLARLREREAAASREAGAREATERTKRAATQALQSAEEALEKATAAEAEIAKELPALENEVKVLRACELVLGLRGARAGIFAKLLGGLEAAANAWLPKLTSKDIRMELKPYSEKKSGGVTDCISLQVHGIGGGHGYKATSQGERRRQDIALLLAFAGQGTLFFDEVFDSVDKEGIDAVAQVISELAAERCVVVITHNEDLADRVPHVAHWRVKEGVVG